MTASTTTDTGFALRLKETMQKKSFKQVDLLERSCRIRQEAWQEPAQSIRKRQNHSAPRRRRHACGPS